MTLKEQIQNDRKQAVLNRNDEKKRALTTLLGELDRISKSPTDNEIIPIIKGLVESNKITNTPNENKYLDIYLPKSLSRSELEKIIKDIINDNNITNMKSMGLVMKSLKENYTGQYDGKIASEITKKEILKNGN